MSYKDSNKKPKEVANKSPLDQEIFNLIESGEAPKATTKEYLTKIENFLFDDANIDHPDYLEIQRQLALVGDFLENFPDDFDPDPAKTTAASSFGGKRLRCTEAELDEKITRIIENENLAADKLQGVLSYISDEIGMHPLELEKYYRVKRDRIENQGHLEDIKREVDSILKLEKVRLKLEDVIPNQIGNLIYDYAENLELRPETCLTALLSGFSACHKIGNHINLYGTTGYRQHPAIFGAIVANAASLKSEIRNRFAVYPMLGMQKKMIEAFEASEKEKKEAEIEFRQMSKDEKQANYPDGLPDYPERAQAILVDDPTFEALALNYHHYPEQAILYSRDELIGIFASLNKYRGGKGADESQLLSFYDGGSMSVIRVKGGATFVEKTSLSIFGTIQPQILANLWGDGEDANGMFSRFNYCWQPDVFTTLPDEDGEFKECPLDAPLKELFEVAQSMPPMEYKLSRKAYTRYKNFYNFMTERTRTELNPIMKHALNKAKGQCGRYILNLHIMESILNTPASGMTFTISEKMVDKAVNVTLFFLEQVELLHKKLCHSDSQSGKFREIIAISEKLGWIKANDVVRGVRRFRKTDPNQVREWFLDLEKTGYGEIKGRGTRLQFHAFAK